MSNDHCGPSTSQIMEDLGYEAGPEFLKRELDTEFELSKIDGHWSLHAFQAIGHIYAGMCHEHDRLDPSERKSAVSGVMVPRWVVIALAEGWCEYRYGDSSLSEEENQKRAKLTLGQVLKIEGKGRGRSPVLRKSDTQKRDWELALKVEELRMRCGVTVAAACEEIAANRADEQTYGVETVRAARRKYHKLAKQTLERLRVRK